MYDLTRWLVINYDPNSLSTEWHEVPVSKALNVAMEAVFYPHFLLEGIWKLLRLLEIGKEKPLRKAKEVLDRFAAKHVSMKCDEFGMENAREYSIMSMYLTGDNDKSQWKVNDEALQGSLLSLMLTGKDTTGAALTWFFWLLNKHPYVESKIKEELRDTMTKENPEKWHLFTQEELNKLVYLHAALSETLRAHLGGQRQYGQQIANNSSLAGGLQRKVGSNTSLLTISSLSMRDQGYAWGVGLLHK
ncbi:hypothetical protein Ancab_006403 [Ancistrocladus abbreviatus]